LVEKIEMLRAQLGSLSMQVQSMMVALNDTVIVLQKTIMSEEERSSFIKEMFKVNLRRAALQCQVLLAQGNLEAASEVRKYLDGKAKDDAKDVGALSYYHKLMRKLERGEVKSDGETAVLTDIGVTEAIDDSGEG